MALADQLRDRLADQALTYVERARLRCQISKELEEAGDYEGAREALGELWPQIGERPVLDNLDQTTAAEVLLRAGVLTGWIGSAKQIEGAQETAKDLISESTRIFEALQESEKVAEAQTDLGYCYWRMGALDDARVVLREVSDKLPDANGELKAIALLRRAIVERTATRFSDALGILNEAAPLVEASNNHALKGKFYNQLATVLENLSRAEHRDDYRDRAFVEYAAASFHFEQAGHARYHACVENNVGFLFFTIGRFSEAHEHLNRARRLLLRLKDSVHVAQVDDTRARVLLAQGHASEAESLIQSTVHILEKGDEQSLLAEALTTHGIALARIGRHERAQLTLQRAITTAEQAGDLDAAGRAALTIIEELSQHIPYSELYNLYNHASELLIKRENPSIASRLLSCASRVLHARTTAAAIDREAEEFRKPSTWEGFSLREAVRRYERFLIELALKDAGGIVTRASQLLGFKHHQSLISLINKRHKNLVDARSPIVPRGRRLIRGTGRPFPRPTDKATQPITILYVEDNQIVTDAVRETLESEGWKVDVCAEGISGLTRIVGGTHYNLLLLDNEVPGLKGLELVRLARKLPHRRRTPIIMLSAAECETEAWRAGVDAFLKKPDEVLAVVKTITRLLRIEIKQD